MFIFNLLASGQYYLILYKELNISNNNCNCFQINEKSDSIQQINSTQKYVGGVYNQMRLCLISGDFHYIIESRPRMNFFISAFLGL